MYRSKISFLIAPLLFFSFLSWNCTKIDTTSIGSGLLPGVDNVNTFDTIINVITNNFDSANKDCATIFPAEEHVLGFISNDPYFGFTRGIIYTELKPPFFPYYFPANRSVDSVVLVLSYKRFYGDSGTAQKVNVYQILTNNFKPDSSTCTFYDFDNNAPIGSAIYMPKRLGDTVKLFRETSTSQLRIKLSNTFAQSLLAQDSLTGFKSDSTFKRFFQGFAIVPDETYGGKALTYYNLTDTNTKLAIYFKYNITNPTADTGVYYFRLTGLSHSANYINRIHTGGEIERYNIPIHPVLGDSVIYIQAKPGTYAEIKIPDLSTVSNRIIHRAELIMDQVYSSDLTDSYFIPPDFLYLDIKDTAGSYRPIPCDFNTLSGTPDFSTFGGFRTFTKDQFGNRIARYTFNLSRYVQKIVTNKRPSSTLRLSAPDLVTIRTPFIDECGQFVTTTNYPINALTFGRVKLGGGSNTNYRMRLRIIYSKL